MQTQSSVLLAIRPPDPPRSSPIRSLFLPRAPRPGSCAGRVEGLRRWSGMGGLVESLMNLIAHDEEEGSYMAATRVGLAWSCLATEENTSIAFVSLTAPSCAVALLFLSFFS